MRQDAIGERIDVQVAQSGVLVGQQRLESSLIVAH
jgi:hypothetical protein